jgi:hypothetical protein
MKKEQLFREDYFTNSIYWMDKPEWVKKLNKASDLYIKKAQKNNQPAIKERTKKTYYTHEMLQKYNNVA